MSGANMVNVASIVLELSHQQGVMTLKVKVMTLNIKVKVTHDK